MTPEAFTKERCSFRFLRLNQSLVKQVQAHFPGARARLREEPSIFGVMIPTSPDTDFAWIERLIEEHQIPEQDYDVFISIVTDSDSRIISMPRYLVDLVRRIGGQVEFSFTVV